MSNKILFAAIALVLASAATTAMAADPGTARAPHSTLDANGDGVVDRAEAAKSPRLAEHFDRLDRNGDGKLDAGERPQWKGGHRGKRHGEHRGGPEHLDKDGDGRLSREEVDAGKTGARRGNPLSSNFDAIDANKDGYIVRTELEAWHARQRPQREAEMKQRSDERFAEADLNKDGKLSRVEVEEKLPHAAKRFAWLDDNRDGFLSREEFTPQRPF